MKGVPVKDILVVSYTKASATDMRLKIINALFDVAKDENVKNVDKIREEIDNLPFAEIGTMDSFLSRLIKENFEYLKISPKAQQMDETESKDMKRRALKKVMNDEYEKQAEDFIRVASRASGIVDDTPAFGNSIENLRRDFHKPASRRVQGDAAFKRHRQPRQRLRKSHT